MSGDLRRRIPGRQTNAPSLVNMQTRKRAKPGSRSTARHLRAGRVPLLAVLDVIAAWGCRFPPVGLEVLWMAERGSLVGREPQKGYRNVRHGAMVAGDLPAKTCHLHGNKLRSEATGMPSAVLAASAGTTPDSNSQSRVLFACK